MNLIVLLMIPFIPLVIITIYAVATKNKEPKDA